MKKKIIALVLILLIAGLCVFFYNASRKENPNELTLYGNIEIRQVDLSFQVAGLVSKLLKEEGDTVKKGELIAVLDEQDYNANFKKAEAEVERALAAQKDAADKYKRYAPLGVDNTVSKTEIETLYNTQNKANADYNAALANRDYLSYQLKYTKLYAPEDGIIMVRVQEPGSNVQKGQPVYTMAKTNPVWVRAYVNETDLGNIKYGEEVNVYTDTVNPATGKKREYKGQIGYISPVAEFTPKTVQSTDTRTNLVYRIRVYIYDIDEYLRQGMPVTIKVDIGRNENRSSAKSAQLSEIMTNWIASHTLAMTSNRYSHDKLITCLSAMTSEHSSHAQPITFTSAITADRASDILQPTFTPKTTILASLRGSSEPRQSSLLYFLSGYSVLS